MKTYSIIKYYGSTSLDIAHAYEHLFIDSFYHHAASILGVDRAVIGYVGGETFDGIIAIEAWFYDRKVAALFEQFLKKEHLDVSRMKVILSQISAEDHCDVVVTKKTLSSVLAISEAPWQQVDALDPVALIGWDIKEGKPKKTDSKTRFKTAMITCYIPLDEMTIRDRAVFQRLSVIMVDVLLAYVHDNGWYQMNASTVKEKNGYIYRAIAVSLPAGNTKNALIEKEAEAALHTFDVKANYAYIRSHMKSYAAEKLWNANSIERLKFSNVLVGNKKIAELVTEERVKHIFESVEVRVETISRSAAENL